MAIEVRRSPDDAESFPVQLEILTVLGERNFLKRGDFDNIVELLRTGLREPGFTDWHAVLPEKVRDLGETLRFDVLPEKTHIICINGMHIDGCAAPLVQFS